MQSATDIETIAAEEENNEHMPRPMAKSVEEKYMELMKALQFGEFDWDGVSNFNHYSFNVITVYQDPGEKLK